MKKIYNVIVIVLVALATLWFLPWLYSIVFPSDTSDPFVAFSPISDSFVVSTVGDEAEIFTVDSNGTPIETGLTKNDRDSLVPQMYYNQLNARNALPDSIAGIAIDVATLKNSQWVFNSLPRDINRVAASVYPIMESRPKRLELEDPVEIFTLNGDIEFVNMSTNTVNKDRSARFNKVFTDRNFSYPVKSINADITTKKPYDEGYMLIDAEGKVFHMKMQAGQPYMAAVYMPDTVNAQHVFILENPDKRHIALVTTDGGDIYAIERDGYKPVRLPIDTIDPEKQRITIFKNIFNWVVKLSDHSSSRWIALDSEDYSLLGQYSYTHDVSKADEVAKWIFPFRLTFTDIDDCFCYPRVSDFSLKALLIWIAIGLIIYLLTHNKPRK